MCPNLQEQMGPTTTPADLLFFDEPFAQNLIHRRFDELPGANTQGETLDEVREKLFEAMQVILEANREDTENGLSGKPGVTREQLTLHAA